MVCHPASLCLSLFLALDHILGFTTSFKCQFYMLDLWLVILSSLSMVSERLTRHRSSSWSRSEQENRRRGLDLPSRSTPTRNPNPNPNPNPRVRMKEERTYPDSPPCVTIVVAWVESLRRAGRMGRAAARRSVPARWLRTPTQDHSTAGRSPTREHALWQGDPRRRRTLRLRRQLH